MKNYNHTIFKIRFKRINSYFSQEYRIQLPQISKQTIRPIRYSDEYLAFYFPYAIPLRPLLILIMLLSTLCYVKNEVFKPLLSINLKRQEISNKVK